MPFVPNDPLGVDLAWPGNDIDAGGAYVSGVAALTQALLRRLTTPRGGLFYDPNYGTDIRAWVGETTTPDRVSTLQQQIAYARFNVELQRQTLTIVEARFRAGTTSELDVHQSHSTLAQTEAQIPELEISARQTANRLCILLGIPVEDLQKHVVGR